MKRANTHARARRAVRCARCACCARRSLFPPVGNLFVGEGQGILAVSQAVLATKEIDHFDDVGVVHEARVAEGQLLMHCFLALLVACHAMPCHAMDCGGGGGGEGGEGGAMWWWSWSSSAAAAAVIAMVVVAAAVLSSPVEWSAYLQCAPTTASTPNKPNQRG